MSYTNDTTSQVDFGTSRNPSVEIGSTMYTDQLNNFERKLYTRIQYAGEPFFILPPDSDDVFLVGQNSFFLYPMQEYFTSAYQMPSFLAQESYSNGFAKTPTGFQTAQMSLMPKLLVPSQYLIDNGLKDSIQEGVFNWSQGDLTRDKVSSDDAQSSVVFIKALGNVYKEVRLNPRNCFVPSEVSDIDTQQVVGGGAFQMAISFLDTDIPSQSTRSEGTAYPDDYYSDGYNLASSTDDKIQPRLSIRLGDLEISLDMDGKCIASWITGEKNTATINLVSGTGEECIPQAKAASTDRGKTFALTVYPLWDGVVIQSGVQTGTNLINSSSAYLPVIQQASLFECADMKVREDGTKVPFDPENPDEIFITTNYQGKSVIPNLGNASSELILTIYNCNCRVAFAPLFFHKRLKLIHAALGNRAVNGYTYVYQAYPIWTDNGSQYKVDSPIAFTSNDQEGIAEFTEVLRSDDIVLSTENEEYSRVAGELFGEILEMKETIPNTPYPEPEAYQNGIPNWSDYITSISISSTMESCTGSITFDRYGALDGDQASLDEKMVQNIGKISISANGCYNTNASQSGDSSSSDIFYGYTWTASENKSKDGADVTINLVGPEKRLEDIQLVNPPIFDGYKFVDVADYICKFAGVKANLANADQNVRLQMSTDPIETVCFNWTTGMECRQALDQICKDTAHGYIPLDGEIFFFQRGRDGIPSYRGKQWTDFSGENIQTVDTNPDFDNLRNEILLIAMRQVPEEALKDFPPEFPLFPITTMIKNTTNPVVPWPKRFCYTLPGYLTQNKLDEIAGNVAASSSFYEIMGNTTIPGANIKVLDTFLDYIVIGVTQNIDLVSKTWTTSLNLQVGS